MRSVGKDSDHLQLIKFWPSCATGKGVCGGAKIFGSALLLLHAVFACSLSVFHYHFIQLLLYCYTLAAFCLLF